MTKAKVNPLAEENGALKAKVAILSKELERERNRAAIGIGQSIEIPKLEKQLRIIGHIAAGRKDEAVLEILTPLPITFGMNVRFTDDKTRVAAQKEMLEALKAKAIDVIQRVEIATPDSKT